MRTFYITYEYRISQSLIGEFEKGIKSQSVVGTSENPFDLSWTHYIQLLKVKNEDERSFYEIEASENNWSVRELQRQYNSALFERLALSKDKKSIKQLAEKGQIMKSRLTPSKVIMYWNFLG
jgi:hypothetical protein